MRRPILMTALAALLTSSAMFAGGPSTSAEFVSGTVKAIPVNTSGSLDAASQVELKFRYGKTVFAVPYQKITDTQITDPAGHHLWKVPVPKITGRSERFLNITYRDGEESRMMTFKGSASAFKELVDTIDGRRKPQTETSFSKRTPAPVVPEDWWGDRYWKTNRNKDKWPQAAQETTAPGVPGGTKE